MRLVIAVLMLLGGCVVCEGKTVHRSYDAAAAESKETGKPMLFLLKMPGCAPCVALNVVLGDMMRKRELDGVVYGVLDLEEQARDVARLKVRGGFPQLLAFPGPGVEGVSHVGAATRARVKEMIRKVTR